MEMLQITIRDEQEREMQVWIEPDLAVNQALREFLSSNGIDSTNLRFVYDCETISESMTARELGAENGDVISVHTSGSASSDGGNFVMKQGLPLTLRVFRQENVSVVALPGDTLSKLAKRELRTTRASSWRFTISDRNIPPDTPLRSLNLPQNVLINVDLVFAPRVAIRVVPQAADWQQVEYFLQENQPMKVLKDAFIRLVAGYSSADFEFTFRGTIVEDHHTPLSLGISSGDRVNVYKMAGLEATMSGVSFVQGPKDLSEQTTYLESIMSGLSVGT
ncbi:MAG: hypothetical protein M1825_000249 [Sarcosagium campestre]|nr:MAG: hypothetical protein M1825_000249 [Sarcosagium campestre]